MYEWANYLKIPLSVCARDQVTSEKGNFIINLDDSHSNGTHWVAMINKNNEIYYFDSFGLPPPREVTNLKKECIYNTSQYQAKTSVLCGYYCLYFLKNLKNISFEKFLQKLCQTDINKNEKIIENYFSHN